MTPYPSPLTADDLVWRSPAEEQSDRESRAAALEIRVGQELERLRTQREARRRLDAEERPPVAIPQAETLRARLARPQEPLRYRIEGWMPEGANVMLPAQFKSGKTTLRDNAIRSMVDGDDWLGRYRVTPSPGTVLVLDFEMSEAQSTSWFRDQRIRNDDRVVLVTLRGRAAAFNILDDQVRADWVALARGHRASLVVLDCLRPPMDALGLDEHKDGGRFLIAFDAFKQEAGIAESLVIHHMGHVNERARGDSRFRDWPDVSWTLVRQTEDPASPRFISAFGRDVAVPESQLEYDAVTRRLTIAGGSRQDAKGAEALEAIVATLRTYGGKMSGRAIKAAMRDSDHSRDEIDQGLKLGRANGVLGFERGKDNSTLHWVSGVPVSGGVRPVSGVNQKHWGFPVSGCPGTFIGAGRRDTDPGVSDTHRGDEDDADEL